jgi:hypothetical protein
MKSKNRIKIENVCKECGLQIKNLEFKPSLCDVSFGDEFECFYSGGYWTLEFIDGNGGRFTLQTEEGVPIDEAVSYLIEGIKDYYSPNV